MPQHIHCKFLLRNMLSLSCIRLIEVGCASMKGVEIKKITLGEVELILDEELILAEDVEKAFSEWGYSTITNPNERIVEKIKIAAIELIFKANNMNSLIRNSDYISERVQLTYDKLSKIFSSEVGTTLEKYIIALKIERAKELLLQNEFNLSEISYMLGYSSVQYLSNQFRKTTGITVSEFKNGGVANRIPLEHII